MQGGAAGKRHEMMAGRTFRFRQLQMVPIRRFIKTISSKSKPSLWQIAGCLFGVGASVVLIWLFQEVEDLRFNSPDNQHTAIVTCCRNESWMPAHPWQGSDKPGFVRIEDAGCSRRTLNRPIQAAGGLASGAVADLPE